MNWFEWVVPALSVLISVGALVFAGFADRRARSAEERATRADERAERVEQLGRVSFEITRAPNSPTLFGLVARGAETARGIEIDAGSVTGVVFNGNRHASMMEPHDRHMFEMDPGKWGKLPNALKVTWLAPFEGEQYVPLPDDRDAPWSAVIVG